MSCTCDNILPKIRKGNTIEVAIEVLSDGEPVSLVGRDIYVELVGPLDKKGSKVDFIIDPENEHVIRFVFEGKDQKTTGTYRVLVYENRRVRSQALFDKEVFSLVSNSAQENISPDDFAHPVLELSGGGLLVGGKDGLTPYIENGYWYIGGLSTGVRAEGADGADGAHPTGITPNGQTAAGSVWSLVFSDGSRFDFLAPVGPRGEDGVDGYTPRRGVDYWTTEDVNTIIRSVLDQIEIPSVEDDFIVTATYDQATQVYTTDKTSTEVGEAKDSGKKVYLKVGSGCYILSSYSQGIAKYFSISSITDGDSLVRFRLVSWTHVGTSVAQETQDVASAEDLLGVVKDAGYVHTDNNFTNAEKTKLAGIPQNAEANVVRNVEDYSNTAVQSNYSKFLQQGGITLKLGNNGLLGLMVNTGGVVGPAAWGAGTRQFVIGQAVYDAIVGLAPKSSPELTGTPTAPTAQVGTDTQQIATTAFVNATVVSAMTGAAVFKGLVNSAGDISSLEDYKRGWYWIVRTEGSYVGQACEVGDTIYCVSDFSSAYDTSDFSVLQGNTRAATDAEIDAICV